MASYVLSLEKMKAWEQYLADEEAEGFDRGS
jgi:hypothetical protein